MKRYLLLVLVLLQVTLFAKSDFMKMCENPTDSQLVTLHAIMQKEQVTSISKERCEELEIGFYEAKYVSVYEGKVVDLTPFVFFENLKRLNLANNNISDITPLSKLTNLEELELWDNPVTDITPLQNLKLKRLTLTTETPIDLSPLAKLQTLESFHFYGRNEELPDLNKLINLENLSIHRVKVSSLCLFKNSKKLISIDLSYNSLSNLSCIENFQNLEELELENNLVEDISPLTTLSKLEKLKLEEVPVSEVSPLAKIKNLKSFTFYNTKIKYLSPLKKSSSLEYIYNFEQASYMDRTPRMKFTLESCSPIDIKEIKAGISCFEKDGTLKPWWKRMLRQ